MADIRSSPLPDNQDQATFIPIVDLFAGAGGLGEGFNACRGGQAFRTVLSIEQNAEACQTLRLRALFWKLKREEKSLRTKEYRESIQSQKTLQDFFRKHHNFDENKEVWATTLDPNSSDEVIRRIEEALGDKIKDHWVLVGGPPCQAFSLAGRSRMRYRDGSPESDLRPSLYKVYLDILKELEPTIFLMENVESLLSAKLKSEDDTGVDGVSTEEETAEVLVMPRIIKDFKDKKYDLHHVSHHDDEEIEDRRFVVESERHGIPQQRHRVIIMGIHTSLGKVIPQRLDPKPDEYHTTGTALKGLPGIVSKVSRRPMLTTDEWRQMILGFHDDEWWLHPDHLKCKQDEFDELKDTTKSSLKPEASTDIRPCEANIPQPDCFDDPWTHPLDHEPRRHMVDDLRRYLFASYYAALHDGASPHLHDFPPELFPKWSRIRIDSPRRSCQFKRRKPCYEITFTDPSNGWPKWATAATNTKGVRLFLTYKPEQDDRLPKFSCGPDDGFSVRRGTLVLKVKRKQSSVGDPPDSIHLLRLDKDKTQVLTTHSSQCKIKPIDTEHQHFTIENPSNGWPRWAGAAMSDIRLRLRYEPDEASGQQSSEDDFELAGAELSVEVEMDKKIIRKDLLELTLINLDNLTHFSDAFVVQPPDKPAFTITCHAGKDGHKSIHHEPWQCRSLTVREVARIQTFPDNYLFFGKPTKQFIQVGNAVPPKLAEQLADIVIDTLDTIAT